MSNLEKYTKIFTESFEVDAEKAKTLKYQDVEAWDSIGHMDLIASLEDEFDIMMEADDIIDFICLFIIKTYFYLQGSCVCRISFLAFFDGIFQLILTGTEREVYKIQTQMSAVIGDGRDVIEHFSKTFPKEPIIGILLDLNEVRHLQDFFLPGIAHSEVLTGCDRTYSVLFH